MTTLRNVTDLQVVRAAAARTQQLELLADCFGLVETLTATLAELAARMGIEDPYGHSVAVVVHSDAELRELCSDR